MVLLPLHSNCLHSILNLHYSGVCVSMDGQTEGRKLKMLDEDMECEFQSSFLHSHIPNFEPYVPLKWESLYTIFK